MSNINMETNNVHNMKILPMQTPTSSAGSQSWRIKFMGFEIKPFFQKAPRHYAKESLEQFPGMFPQQCLICISILAPLVFEHHV